MKKAVVLMSIVAAAGSMLMTSCQKDDPCKSVENAAQTSAELKINALIGGPQSRSFTEKKQWANGDQLGVFVYDAAGTAFVPGSLNLAYTYSPATGWSAATKITVNSVMPSVCAYYPYASSSSNMEAIPFDRSVDLLYSTPVTPEVKAGNADVTMLMKHALTQFIFKFAKGKDYTAAGKVTALSVEKTAGNLYMAGTVNLKSGDVTPSEPKNILEYTPSADMSSGSAEYGDVLAPSKGDFLLKVTIDGRKYECALKGADWKSGKRNIYSFTLSATDLTLGDGDDGNGKGSGIKIEDWTDENAGSLNLTPVK